MVGTCGYGEELSGSINAGNFLTSGKVYWLASQEGPRSMQYVSKLCKASGKQNCHIQRCAEGYFIRCLASWTRDIKKNSCSEKYFICGRAYKFFIIKYIYLAMYLGIDLCLFVRSHSGEERH